MSALTNEVGTRIARILVQYADTPHLTAEAVEPSMPVFGPGGIISDSLNVLDALCRIEDDLNVSVPDEDLTEELFASLASLVDYIARRLATEDEA